MLRLRGEQVEALWDELLPIGVRELAADLAALDRVLSDEALLAPVARLWMRQWPGALERGRPTRAIATYVRLMVLKQRTGWGYETLVREVSDSLHLRRFSLIALHARVPDESTLRKRTRRLGDEVIAELTRGLIAKAQRETRFHARALRVDSTVVEADVRYPSDAALAHAATATLARQARRATDDGSRPVRDRSRAVARRLRLIGRSVARRAGADRASLLRLTGEAGRLVERCAREARRLLARGAGNARELERLRRTLTVAEQIAAQIRRRLRGEPISERVVSLADPGRAADRQRQARKALGVRLRHPARGAQRTHPPRQPRLPGAAAAAGRIAQRDRAAAADRRRARPPRTASARGLRRRWLPDHHDEQAARRPCRARPQRRPPAARLAPRQTPDRVLPRRLRSPHRLPQTPLRVTPHPPPRPRRRPHLDSLGRARLQRRHPRPAVPRTS
jgi:hypothetical protein